MRLVTTLKTTKPNVGLETKWGFKLIPEYFSWFLVATQYSLSINTQYYYQPGA